MVRPAKQEFSGAQLGERCRAASDARNAAGRALDIAYQNGGATEAELKADFDARIDLRAARKAYVADSLQFTAISAAVREMIQADA